jgi:hypothetical protein
MSSTYAEPLDRLDAVLDELAAIGPEFRSTGERQDFLLRFARDPGIACDGHQLPRDSGRRQNEIRPPRGNGASRHTVEFRREHLLDEGDAARRVDRLES